MTDVAFLADQLHRAHTGNAWHGPALREILADVNAQGAAVQPAPNVHTIGEIVRHITAWLSACARRLQGEALELTPDQDWPAGDDTSDTTWQSTLAALDAGTDALERLIAALPADGLRKGVPGTQYSVRFMLEGVIQHHLYHAGQIALLKKMVAS
jgi:uncharacterized damage-inducible protein DinB